MNKTIRFILNWMRALSHPAPFLGIFFLPRYLTDWIKYSRLSKDVMHILDSHPCLFDVTRATPFDNHYFFQASWLARRIVECAPKSHVDCGSDVKMIGVLSAFVSTKFIDFRPLKVEVPNLTCLSGDLTSLMLEDLSVESLSCLHVVEHVGLGRYGDRLDPAGTVKALTELERVLAVGGSLYLSVPVGRQRVCFNAHRVFSPSTIVSLLPELNLRSFALVDDQGRYFEDQTLTSAQALEYGCGLFHFVKSQDGRG